MEIRSTLLNNGEIIGQLKNMADILREEMMQHRNWSFNGSFEDFDNPPLLQFFLTHLLIGRHVTTISGMRNEELVNTVDVACQFIVQNTRSDRQVNHQPKRTISFSILSRRPSQLACSSPSIPECVTRTSSITCQKYTLGATTGGSLPSKSV